MPSSEASAARSLRLKRTHNCGDLRKQQCGQEIIVNGWVHHRRDHGGLIFIDVRDRSGVLQAVFDPAAAAEAHARAGSLRAEYVVAIRGQLEPRPAGSENPDLATGEVELRAQELEVLNPARTPPFAIAEEEPVDENLRLRYRYLDLRRQRIQHNLELRHRAAQATRQFLTAEGFWEVETPMLFKQTPEGARDYLVPSRVNPGKFYALPQSPQLMKQLLMVAGFERYFQLARCLRDEDLRADRQPEHTQIDLEMSFVRREDVLDLVERLFHHIWQETIGIELPIPFPRLTYREALARYGTDKPDLRFGLELVDLTELVKDCEFQVFARAVSGGGEVKGLCAPGCASYGRAELDKLTAFAQEHKAKGLAWMQVKERGVESPIAKFFQEQELAAIVEAFGAKPGDLLLMVADEPPIVAESLDWLRREMGQRLGLIDGQAFAPLWVLDFPLFAWNADEKRWEAEHHPFCMPHEEDWDLLDTDPGQVRAQAYDVVINGIELGSGSIRIHRRDIQMKVFKALGITEEEATDRFGFLLEAFEYGTPPHGGVAPGFDRIVMMLAHEPNIREVMAFPKTQSAQCLMSGSPSEVEPKLLRELHLKLDLPENE